MRTIAIIPARGGSKRLPGKNIMNLGGLPLIVHSINYAKANKSIIDRIIVSTDDENIKMTAINAGVEVIDRPADLSSDTATTVSVLKHVLENIKEDFENIILLQPTNPLRPEDLLKKAFENFIIGEYDSLITVTRSTSKFGKIIENKFVPVNYKIGVRSQDLEVLFYENGLLYITKVSQILQGKILGEKNIPFVVNHPYAKVDIDEKVDLEYAEFLLKVGV